MATDQSGLWLFLSLIRMRLITLTAMRLKSLLIFFATPSPPFQTCCCRQYLSTSTLRSLISFFCCSGYVCVYFEMLQEPGLLGEELSVNYLSQTGFPSFRSYLCYSILPVILLLSPDFDLLDSSFQNSSISESKQMSY